MAVTYPNDAAVTARLQSSLRPGEQLLWCGRPDLSVIFVPADIFVIPFSIVWLGVALLWEFGTQSIGAPVAFRLAGVPFALIGVYMVVGRLVTRWFRKRRTIYGVTGSRVIVQTGWVFKETPVQGGSMSVRRVAPGSLVFADVADPDAMLAAINQAKAPRSAPSPD